MLVAHIPETPSIRVGGDAFKHQRGCAVGQRAVHDVRVTCYPAHVSRTPVNFAVFIVKHGFVGHCRLQQVAASGVQCAFRLTGRTRSVENEEWVVRFHVFRRAICIRSSHGFVIPNVTCVVPFNRITTALYHDASVNGWALIHRFISIAFQWHFLAAAHGLVRSNDHAAFRILDTVTQCIR